MRPEEAHAEDIALDLADFHPAARSVLVTRAFPDGNLAVVQARDDQKRGAALGNRDEKGPGPDLRGRLQQAPLGLFDCGVRARLLVYVFEPGQGDLAADESLQRGPGIFEDAFSPLLVLLAA